MLHRFGAVEFNELRAVAIGFILPTHYTREHCSSARMFHLANRHPSPSADNRLFPQQLHDAQFPAVILLRHILP
jgi:hypothetical protein